MSHFARRTDGNQAAIVEALREAGYPVWLTHRVGFGFPDLLCVSKSRIAVLLEVKDGVDGLNENERQFFTDYHALKYIVRTPENAIDTMQFVDEMEVV